ncbi:hypothetical protein EIM50_23795, partial [Pseudoxanthomonas sp. SGD-10]
MKKINLLAILGIVSTSLFFGACKKDNNEPINEGDSKYVLITLSDRVSGTKAGYISAFDAIPTGTISNVSAGSLEGQGMGGWRTYANWIFKMFRTSDYKTGIEKINVAKDGTVTTGTFIASKDDAAATKYFGTGNLVIQNETSGFYWDAAEPLKIQKFNPSTMTNTGSLDFASVVNATPDSDNAAITFKAIGQKFLAIKGGKLFANITYGKNPNNQFGFFDDYFPDVYIAVIDIATGAHEKTIKILDAGSIAYINENHMYDFDTNGDLYIVTQGKHPQGLGAKSKIVRIKANSTDIDTSWELKFSEFRAEDNGKFVNVFAKDGKLIVTLNTVTLSGGPNGNINSQDIWKFYTVDVAT